MSNEHITEADALRDEVARWRKEAAEQAEIAHKLRVALEGMVADWERVHGELPIDHEARAALAGEAVEVTRTVNVDRSWVKVEEPEVSPTPSFYR